MSGHGYSHHNPSPTPTASNSSRMDVQGTYVKDIGELPVPESSKQRIEAFFSANSLEFINHRFTQTVSFQGPVGTDLLQKEVTIIVPPEVAKAIFVYALLAHPLLAYQPIQPGFEKNGNRQKVHTQRVKSLCYFNVPQTAMGASWFSKQLAFILENCIRSYR